MLDVPLSLWQEGTSSDKYSQHRESESIIQLPFFWHRNLLSHKPRAERGPVPIAVVGNIYLQWSRCLSEGIDLKRRKWKVRRKRVWIIRRLFYRRSDILERADSCMCLHTGTVTSLNIRSTTWEFSKWGMMVAFKVGSIVTYPHVLQSLPLLFWQTWRWRVLGWNSGGKRPPNNKTLPSLRYAFCYAQQ